jgi:hypothetical protein
MYAHSEIKNYQIKTNRNEAINSTRKKMDFLYQNIQSLNEEFNNINPKNFSNTKNKKQNSYSNLKKFQNSQRNIFNNDFNDFNKLYQQKNINITKTKNTNNNNINNYNNMNQNNAQFINNQESYRKRKSLPKKPERGIIGIDELMNKDEQDFISGNPNINNPTENNKYNKYENKIIYMANNQNIHNYHNNNKFEGEKSSIINKIIGENKKLKQIIKNQKEKIDKITKENTTNINQAEQWSHDYNEIFKEKIKSKKTRVAMLT